MGAAAAVPCGEAVVVSMVLAAERVLSSEVDGAAAVSERALSPMELVALQVGWVVDVESAVGVASQMPREKRWAQPAWSRCGCWPDPLSGG